MKLDKVLEHLQKQTNTNMADNTTLPSTSQQQQTYSHVLNNLFNYNYPTQNVVPLNEEDVSQGLLAIGGCRQCSKTFTDRLSLIHHFADHFPNIFYSFEERPCEKNVKIPQQQQQIPLNINIPQTITSFSPNEINRDFTDIVDQQSSISPRNDEQIWGQLGMLLSLFGINPNNCSQQMMTNFLSSLQIPIKNNNNFNSMGMPPFATTTTINSPFPLKNISPQNQFNLNKINENLFDKKEDKKELTGNDLINLKNQNLPVGRKKRRSTAENIMENYSLQKESFKSFVKNGNNEKNGKNEAKKSAENINQQPTLSELPYHMCPHCCLTFAETANYKAHLELHKQPLQLNTTVPHEINSFCDSQNDQKQKQKLQTKCPLCEMEFNNIFRLNEHIRLHSAHSCDTCQKTFMTAFDLNLHMGTHTGFTYDCKDCGKCFPCRKTLAEHNRSHRLILSNSNICKNNDKNDNISKNQIFDDKQKQLNYEMESPPILQFFEKQQNIEQNGRKKIRATRKGEKSRRNATLVALESTTTPATNTQQTETSITTNNLIPQTSPLNNCFNNNTLNIDDVEQKHISCGNSAMGIMGNILMKANSLLSVYGQNKIPENVDLENEQKPELI
uniref:C2H2-type domain-containing protein n=1 Tax=Meloidogyne floridensis TaxID=298350 RepID=A0A915ND51_9BILA